MLLALVAEVRQEAVVKEAAHRPPSLGRRTDNPPRSADCRPYDGPVRRLAGQGTGPGPHGAAPRLPESDICHNNPRIAFRSQKGFGHIEHQPSQEPHELANVLAQAARFPAYDRVRTGRRAESGPAMRHPEPGTHQHHRGESIRTAAKADVGP
ncbi:hypothetical protein Stsp01_31990 [Streptomyces sp. NBRC 13847]|nr:hypothetical protein Stsp01_31990 [Streptomyces sp. NBRC 13847]